MRDEMREPSGEPRAHWRAFVAGVQALGADEMARRWAQARRLIHENGVTYNVYGDPRGMQRPWELDALPLLVSADEWRALEPALAQRGRLLNAILADLYGPQRLLAEGLLPPEIVFAHPGFLRPCHGAHPPGGIWLHLAAFDLARAADGRWWAIADRAQAPSGAGYALENRIVLSRTLPEVFRDCRVQRLAGFFGALRETLAGLAPRPRESPRIVLLTPGPFNETYFEHAYLARYLGYTLAEGADLTVRGRSVYLKTLGGLEPVDVILRRLDDSFCDPLSLRADSSLGVAGLVHCAQAGNVVVANALGSGLVETPALIGFLPGLCRALLGEELALPSVPTWWCGQPAALDHVRANLHRLVLKPAFPSVRMEPVFGGGLSSAERAAMLARLEARPHEFVAQEQMSLSAAPVWDESGVRPRHVVWRSYVAASAGGYVAMPGGLTRASASPDSLVVSMQRGGGSKDTWVLTDGPVSPLSLLRSAPQAVELTRGGGEMPSRVADNLFWLGRYVERAEGTARLLRGILERLVGDSPPGSAPELRQLLEALAAQAGASGGFATGGDGGGARTERALLAFLCDAESPRTLRATVSGAQRAASLVRDQISTDTWRVLSRLEDHVTPPAAPIRLGAGEALDRLNRLILSLAAFSGLGMESMTRGQGWRFADMGRRIERASFVTALLRGALVRANPEEGPLLEALLEVADASITYRRRYLGTLQLAPVLDLLLTDETNPRSLAFQLAALAEHVARLPRAEEVPGRSPEERIALALATRVRLADVARLAAPGPGGARRALDEFLVATASDLAALADRVTRAYLSHAEPPRRLEDLRVEDGR